MQCTMLHGRLISRLQHLLSACRSLPNCVCADVYKAAGRGSTYLLRKMRRPKFPRVKTKPVEAAITYDCRDEASGGPREAGMTVSVMW